LQKFYQNMAVFIKTMFSAHVYVILDDVILGDVILGDVILDVVILGVVILGDISFTESWKVTALLHKKKKVM
jgi:hypothetical protein